jgi:hypothetical protein
MGKKENYRRNHPMLIHAITSKTAFLEVKFAHSPIANVSTFFDARRRWRNSAGVH